MSFRLLDERDIVSLNKNYSNALIGNLKGEVVRADDVSPLEHNMRVKVKSKNLFPKFWDKITDELTVTVDEDGTVHLNGTPTKDGNVQFTITLEKAGFYCLADFASGVFPEDENARIQIYDPARGTALATRNTDESNVVKEGNFFANEVWCRCRYVKGFTYNDCTLKPTLFYDETPTEYTPYVDPASVTVARCGKNLFNLRNIEPTQSGSIAYISEVGDNYIIIPGTSNTYCDTRKKLVDICPNIKAGETYTLSGITDSVNNYIYLGGNVKQSWRYGYAKLITEEMLTAPVVIYGSENKDCKISNIQMELGEVETDYEPYKGESFTPSADGSCDIVSVSPTMTLLTDKAGATIECEYNRDANVVTRKLMNAIIALGGTV